MIPWKQRLYAFLLRRILDPFLDSQSKMILHESIEVSLHEGKFAMSNIGLSTAYLNSLPLGPVGFQRARIRMITIQLSLEEQNGNEESSSLKKTWNLLSVGGNVNLCAHVAIEGLELDIEPTCCETRTSSVDKPTGVPAEGINDRSTISRFLDSAIASLRLCMRLTDAKIKFFDKKSSQSMSWVQLRVGSFSYDDRGLEDKDSPDRALSTTLQTKLIRFEGISIQAGEATTSESEPVPQDHLVSTIAVATAPGQIIWRLSEISNTGEDTSKTAMPTIQNDVDINLNSQIKVSVDDIALLHVMAVSSSFTGKNTIEDSSEQVNLEIMQYDDDQDRMDIHTLEGIMKQYAEARNLAEKNQHLKGGILVPTNAFEQNKETEEFSGTFDVFFDAHDMGSIYGASVMNASANDIEDKEGKISFVQKKVRLHVLGVELKLNFGARSKPNLSVGSLEYVIMTCNDICLISSILVHSSRYSFSISHLEVEDSQVEPGTKNSLGPRPAIGSVLQFAPQHSESHGLENCVTVEVTIDEDSSTERQLNAVVCLQPVEITYRSGTFSNLAGISSLLGESAQSSDDDKSSQSELILPNEEKLYLALQVKCQSLTLNLPSTSLRQGYDIEAIYSRCGYPTQQSPVTVPTLGVAVDNISFELRFMPKCTEEKTDADFSCDYVVVFVCAPASRRISMTRETNRMDILVASGRMEVDPYIPISCSYRIDRSNPKLGSQFFPIVPSLSSFKARQQDEDEENELDRTLSAMLGSSHGDTRSSLRSIDLQSSMLAEAGCCSSMLHVHIPEVLMDIADEELVVLLDIITGISPKTETPQKHSGSKSSLALSLECDSFILGLSRGGGSGICQGETTSDYTLSMRSCRTHALAVEDGIRQARFLAHELNLHQMMTQPSNRNQSRHHINSTSKQVESLRDRILCRTKLGTIPIFYRSSLYPIISPESPSLLVDVVQLSTLAESTVEKRMHISIYNMTHRYNVESNWVEDLSNFFAFPQSNDEVFPEGSTEAKMSSKVTLTRVFLSLADSNIDYTPPAYFETPSRTIVHVGDLRLSSNIMSPSTTAQAFSLSSYDISISLCPSRYPHLKENSQFAEVAFSPSEASMSSSSINASLRAKPTEFTFRNLNAKTMLTLSSVDAIVAVGGSKEANKPKVTTTLTFGELSFYACKDSFDRFSKTLGELQLKLSAINDDELSALKKKSEEEKVSTREGFSTETIQTTQAEDNLEVKRATAEERLETSEGVTGDFLLDGYDWTAIDFGCSPKVEIPNEDDQAAGWYNCSRPIISEGFHENSSDKTEVNSSRLITQHFPFVLVSDPFSDADSGNDRTKDTGPNPSISTQVSVHDLNVKLRFFDGYDWPEKLSTQAQKETRRGNFVIEEPKTDPTIGDGALSSSSTKSNPSDTKTKLMEDLLGGRTGSNETFRDLPLPAERGVAMLAEAELRRLSRRTSCYLQMEAKGMKARIDAFEDCPDNRLASYLQVSVSELFLAETISTRQPVKMMGEWVSDYEHPRDTNDGLLEMKIKTWHPEKPVTSDNTIANDICEAELKAAPLRCMLDQRAVQFAKTFFGSDEEEDGASVDPKWTSNLHIIPAPVFRQFRVLPIKMKIDYTPKEIDVAALRNGSFVEFINLCPLDSMTLTLMEVEVENAVGFGEAMGLITQRWLNDVCSNHIHKFLTNARPFEPISSIGGGVADLVLLPWDAYKHGDNVPQALRSGISSFAGTFAYETLTTTSRVAEYIAGQMAKASASTTDALVSHGALPSRPVDAPRRLSDATGHAIESLARGVQTANYKVVIVPLREYRKGGATGAAKTMLTGIPIAVVAPMSGATEAISYALLGARNQIRPDIRKEEQANQVGLQYVNR